MINKYKKYINLRSWVFLLAISLIILLIGQIIENLHDSIISLASGSYISIIGFVFLAFAIVAFTRDRWRTKTKK